MYPKKIDHWIDNAVVTSPKRFSKMQPATGKIVATVARGGQREVILAVTVARRAFGAWAETLVMERAKLLRRAADLLEAKKTLWGKWLALELGKNDPGGASVVAGAVEHARYWSGEGTRFFGRTLMSKVPHRLTYTSRIPVGISVVIAPSNSSFGARAVFPALLAGNTVIVKPPEQAPLAAQLLGEIFREVGLPSGVYGVVQGYGEEVGRALVEANDVDLVSFTGSVAVGQDIQVRIIKRQGKFAKLGLELGGKNALVVADDADLERAVTAAVDSVFVDAGQRCAAASRLIIFESVYDEFIKRFLLAVGKLSLGVGAKSNLGPLISQKQQNLVATAVTAAVARGAQLLTGGATPTEPRYRGGYYYLPTVLANVPPDDPAAQTEIFGPVVIVFKVKNLAEAIKLTNSTPYGLTAAIFTQNIDRAQTFATAVQAGVVNINGPTFGSEAQMPFGGVKISGNGVREGGEQSLELFTHSKTISIRHTPEV